MDEDKICNGVFDCVDAADERDCGKTFIFKAFLLDFPHTNAFTLVFLEYSKQHFLLFILFSNVSSFLYKCKNYSFTRKTLHLFIKVKYMYVLALLLLLSQTSAPSLSGVARVDLA